MKELMLLWSNADGERPGRVEINAGKGRTLTIVPKHRKTASPIGVFLTLLEVLEYLGFERDSDLINKCSGKPEKGQSIRLLQK